MLPCNRLLTTTAALALVGGAASAQEWDLGIGGHVQVHTVYTSIGGAGNTGVDGDGVNFMGDTEIDFSPSITLDNGITFGGLVELEGQADGGSMIDHTFMFIEGDTLGRIELGNLNGVSYNNGFLTPGVGSIGVNSGTMSMFIPMRNGTQTAHNDMSGDNFKINYTTPSFNGFTLGVSYTPSTQGGNSRDAGAIDRSTGTNDIYDVTANYSQSFGTMDIALHAGYQQADRNAAAAGATTFALAQEAFTEVEAIAAELRTLGDTAWAAGDGAVGVGQVVGTAGTAAVTAGDPSIWRIGASVGSGPFTVGAVYQEMDNDNATSAGDKTDWAIGMTYAVDAAWTIGVDYINTKVENAAGNTASEENAYRIGASRTLGPGVTWDVQYNYYEHDAAAAADDQDGSLFATTITLNF